MPVMRKPEMTKKTSTPTKPPDIPGTAAWNRTTARTATARSPSMSGRNPRRDPSWPQRKGYGDGRKHRPDGGRLGRTLRATASGLQRTISHEGQVPAQRALGEEVREVDQGEARGARCEVAHDRAD